MISEIVKRNIALLTDFYELLMMEGYFDLAKNKKENIKKDMVLPKSKKAIVLVYGVDRTGIIFNVCKILYNFNINILDIDQTVLGGYFNMMAVVDISKVKNVEEVKKGLSLLAKKMKLNINFQLEETFLAMHQL